MKKIGRLILLVLILTGVGYGCSSNNTPPADPIYLTLNELKEFNGTDGRPTYVAVNGEIYDLTKCSYWKSGIHNKSPKDAIAGRDLTEVLANSSHGIKRVKKYPLVGYIKK